MAPDILGDYRLGWLEVLARRRPVEVCVFFLRRGPVDFFLVALLCPPALIFAACCFARLPEVLGFACGLRPGITAAGWRAGLAGATDAGGAGLRRPLATGSSAASMRLKTVLTSPPASTAVSRPWRR